MHAVPTPRIHVSEQRTASVIPTSTFTLADLDALRAAYVKQVPPGAFTVDEYRERYSLSESSARRELTRLRNAGQVDSATTNRDGHQVRVYWRVK